LPACLTISLGKAAAGSTGNSPLKLFFGHYLLVHDEKMQAKIA
jgi:hypothetical protein